MFNAENRTAQFELQPVVLTHNWMENNHI